MREAEYLREFEQVASSGDFQPLAVAIEAQEFKGSTESRFDAMLRVGWGGRWVKLFAEHKSNPSPLVIERALDKLAGELESAQQGVLLVNYLSEAAQRALFERQMSGMDLCGNYIIQTPELVALRLDRPNRFPSRALQNIYGGQSSLVGRLALVVKPLPTKLADWSDALEARGGQLAISTISKVLSGLRDDALLSADRSSPQLLRPSELLARLASAYQPPTSRVELKLKLPSDPLLRDALIQERLGEGVAMWSGDTSASRYGAGMPPTVSVAYTSSALQAHAWSDLLNERFYNCIIREVHDPTIFFDRRGLYASPVQSYLELASGDARARELAQSISSVLSQSFK
jgi:hypothetical protein